MTVGLLSFASVAPYEGSVASRARIPYFSSNSFGNQYLSRTAHVATDNIAVVRFAFGNYNVFGPPEGNLGTSATETYSIEYPVGTFLRLTVSGASPTAIPAGGIVFTDLASIAIPSGATFFVWRYGSNSGGVQFCQAKNTFLGDKCQIGASVADGTLTGIITDNSPSNAVLPPCAILATKTTPSVVIVGDSIGWGSFDTEDTSSSATGYNGKIGVVARSLGNIPFINLSMPGVSALNWATSSPSNRQMIQKGSHLITQVAQNDIGISGQSSAQLIASIQTIWGLARSGQKLLQATVTPSDGSTDGWLTLANQTPNQAATRLTFNTAVRSGLSGATTLMDVAGVLENGSSGKWVVSPSPPYTGSDGQGIHPTPAGYALVQAANILPALSWP